MENKRNYYRLLHVQFDAPSPVIKASYRTMMQKMRLHPDLGGDEGNAQLLNLALATLLDPEKRATYDKWLKQHQPESLKPSKRNNDVKSNTVSPQSSSSNTHTTEPLVDPDLVHCVFCGSENSRPRQLNQNRMYSQRNICVRCSAPLNEVANIESTMSDELRRMQRNILRATCEIQFDADSEKCTTAQVVDFSLLGLSLEHDGKLAVGQVVLIRSTKFSCVAQTSYSDVVVDGKTPDDVRSGLEFITLELNLPKGELLSSRY